jgi:predicted rRNA methylase YqxC with S4 and FtsJ domains
VRDTAAVDAALRRLRDWCAGNGYAVKAEAQSAITGAEGNQEIFLYLSPE